MEEQASQTLKTTNKRTFCPNGSVANQAHFFVDPSEWNSSHLIHKLLGGTYSVLIAPSQTGKTTRVKTLIEQIHSMDGNSSLCIYIDLSGVVASKEGFFKAFVKNFSDRVKYWTNIQIPNDTLFENLFSPSAYINWYQNKNVILIIDEVDCLNKVNNTERMEFLGLLRTWKQFRQDNCLISTLLITNYTGECLIDSLGHSSFNASEYVHASYFTLTEVNELISQYEQQENVEISKEIKEDIFEQTNGAQGLTSMYCKQLADWVNKEGRAPNYGEWVNFSNSDHFFVIISSYPNYMKMITTLENDKSCNTVLAQLLSNRVLKENLAVNSTAGKLIAANILTSSFSFANPFAKKLITTKLDNRHKPPIDVPFCGKVVDFFELVCKVVPFINPLSIVGAAKMSKSYCGECPKGPKESVYVLAFHLALRHSLYDKVNIVMHPEVGGKSCDSLISIFEHKIAVEHGANLNLEKDCEHQMSVHKHVSQAEYYQKNMGVDQTWVINWTTVSDGTLYNFPDSKLVNVLYIYHDESFSTVNVVANNKNKIVQIPNLDFGMEQFEPSPKKKKHGEIPDLEKLAQLFSNGILSSEEFHQLKKIYIESLNKTNNQ